ncbi:hypothetical protein C3L33_17730, partial [Rhododendron williamsianum]
TRAGYSRADQFYASYPAGTELLTDTAKLYKAALGNCFEEEEWGPIEWSVMAKHFERQGKSPYAYHAVVACKEAVSLSLVAVTCQAVLLETKLAPAAINFPKESIEEWNRAWGE